MDEHEVEKFSKNKQVVQYHAAREKKKYESLFFFSKEERIAGKREETAAFKHGVRREIKDALKWN